MAACFFISTLFVFLQGLVDGTEIAVNDAVVSAWNCNQNANRCKAAETTDNSRISSQQSEQFAARYVSEIGNFCLFFMKDKKRYLKNQADKHIMRTLLI